jgi:hypothetical protein
MKRNNLFIFLAHRRSVIEADQHVEVVEFSPLPYNLWVCSSNPPDHIIISMSYVALIEITVEIVRTVSANRTTRCERK